MTSSSKRKLLIFLLLFTAALALVAAGLPGLDLKRGLPPPYLEGGQIFLQDEPGAPALEYGVNKFVIQVLLTVLVVGLVLMVLRSARGIGWRELLRSQSRFIAGLLVFAALLASAVYMLPSSPEMVVEPLEIPPPPPVVLAPLGAPPVSLVWLVGALLGICALLIAVWLVRSRHAPQPALVRLGNEADKARQALLTGMSLREVILECYHQMSRVLQEENGIERQAYMTTGDFERLLAAEGFPAAPVHQLTLLFDAVRYGRWQPGPGDEQQAVDCLEAITRYSKGTRQVGEHE